MFAELLLGSKSYFGAEKFALAVELQNEPLLFGIPEGKEELSRYLKASEENRMLISSKERGFSLKDVKEPKDLLNNFIPGQPNIIGCLSTVQAAVI